MIDTGQTKQDLNKADKSEMYQYWYWRDTRIFILTRYINTDNGQIKQDWNWQYISRLIVAMIELILALNIKVHTWYWPDTIHWPYTTVVILVIHNMIDGGQKQYEWYWPDTTRLILAIYNNSHTGLIQHDWWWPDTIRIILARYNNKNYIGHIQQ